MSILIIFETVIKALLLLLGILAYKGHAWAFGLFVGVSATVIVFDIILAIIAYSADKDIERNDLL